MSVVFLWFLLGQQSTVANKQSRWVGSDSIMCIHNTMLALAIWLRMRTIRIAEKHGLQK